jgi:hydroxypyruvate isomerase
MIEIVLDSGYRGWIGVEYEGQKVGEFEGIIRTRDLLQKIRNKHGATA